MTIIKKTVGYHNKSWDSKFKYAVWAYIITKKESTEKSPFELVYGLEVTLPIPLKIPVYKVLQQLSSDPDAVQNRVNQLIELDETRRHAFDHLVKNQEKKKSKLYNTV